MNKKGGLGKGLGALFAESNFMNDSVAEEESVVSLNISQIEPNRNQPRYCFDEESIKSLSESIKTNGVIQPILVRKLAENKFEIIAGERRFRASRMAGLETIPAVIRAINEKKSTELALIENLQREDLNPIEEAKGFLFLMKNYGLTQEEVAKKVGKSRSAVANIIRLLNLPEEILKFVEEGSLSEGQARALLSIENLDQMKQLALKAVKNGLSVRELERLCSSKGFKKKLKKSVLTTIYIKNWKLLFDRKLIVMLKLKLLMEKKVA